MKNWKRQNRIQRYGEEIFRYFRPKNVNYPFHTYRPKIKRWKISLVSIWIGICLIVPFTGWTIPYAIRWMVK